MPTTSSATSSAAPTAPVVGMVIFDGCDELDAIGPANVLFAVNPVRFFLPPDEAEAVIPPVVHFVSEDGGTVTSANGVVLTATTSYADCPPLDVLLVAGGSGTHRAEVDPYDSSAGRHYQNHHEPTLAFVRERAAEARIVGSICTGTFVLAGAGLVAGKRVNTHWAYRNDLERFMAERDEPVTVVPERVVADGDLLTCGGVSSGIDLAVEVVRRLYGDAVAQGAAAAVERETPAA